MSFSRQFSGTAAVILAAVAAFAAEQRAQDEEYGIAGVTEGHAKQIAASTTAVTPILQAAPAETSMSVGIYGHANADESGDYGWSLSAAGSGATPAVAPAVPDAAPATPAETPDAVTT